MAQKVVKSREYIMQVFINLCGLSSCETEILCEKKISLRNQLHIAVFDTIVNHLYKVAGSATSDLQEA